MKGLNGIIKQSHLILILLILPSVGSSSPTKISSGDVRSIKALENAYVTAWVRNDRQAVLRTLSKDAVIVPSGSLPIVGIGTIEKFWWPNDGSRTTITRYTTIVEEIGGSGSVAYVRGVGQLSFTYEKDGKKTEHTNKSVYLMVVQRQKDRSWLITHRMWAALSA